MVKLVDTADSKSAGLALASSSLATSTIIFVQNPQNLYIVKSYYQGLDSGKCRLFAEID